MRAIAADEVLGARSWARPSAPHMLSCFSHVQHFATPWTVAHQIPLSMGFSRQEYWSGLSCPPAEDLRDPGIELTSLLSPALAGGFFTTNAVWEAQQEAWLVSNAQTWAVCHY